MQASEIGVEPFLRQLALVSPQQLLVLSRRTAAAAKRGGGAGWGVGCFTDGHLAVLTTICLAGGHGHMDATRDTGLVNRLGQNAIGLRAMGAHAVAERARQRKGRG